VAHSEVAAGAPWVFPALLGASLLLGALIGPSALATVLTIALQAVFLVFFVRHLAFVVTATRTSPADAESGDLTTAYTPPVSVLVACHNEERVLFRLLTALTAVDYPPELLQLIIVDDGSTDRTGDMLERFAVEDGRLLVLRRPIGAGGGKSGALNHALPHVTGDVVVVFDADHRPHPHVLRRLARHFADPAVGAVQGNCRILNGDASLVAALVRIDYLAGYLVNEFGRQAIFRLPAYGGANCAVRTTSLRRAGGWNERTVTEDTDLTLRLALSGQRVCYDITALDEEEAVTTLRQYWRQRYRWARGHQQVWRDFRGAVWRSRRLSPLEKVETTMFLLVFHVPVLAVLGLVLLAAALAGFTPSISPLSEWSAVLWTLLLLGPMLELSCGLLLVGASRRAAFTLLFFLPLFVLSMGLCAKAWVDGLLGRPYTWAKTVRDGDPGPRPARPVASHGRRFRT
jgi:1,2-diacylglycerol 3-beta-glucosyltransferase